ncbi:oxidoreductase, short chain dehydrogenase/reductase family [Talaromyces stipitatus ATCC 10500]|uniref:Oxidoreductase, short chain dehydrogenase/reductase family n=1 Tax=Talaromyces stipitatus (strain ATCC 10500 / CBS 375.48 / QM 6759 / NRRL 1006) TaxID=441959 RepID=B8M2B0_TALSN|nr:oxidoreductase, short chain dehydrogenase/reductase family [Talaromyces stipitatus ATCC 10500]EED21574.1 oxidoreductase, short chain dehydrogenase/reductase family [Talaromyces stipitatus ATCC 10500]
MAGSMPLKYMSKLAGSRVLILGGTSGIGFAVAEAALEHGATVIISSSRENKLQNALSRLREAYPDPTYHARINGYTCDLGTPENLDENIAKLLAQVTKNSPSERADDQRDDPALLDHIIYTAGDAIKVTPVPDLTVDTIQRMGTVRFMGPLLLSKLAPRYMKKSSTSSITLTSGSQSLKPMPNWTAVVAYSTGTEGMMRGLAVDLAPIRVNCVAPGAVHTELFNDISADRLDSVLESMASATLVGKVGKPEDVAEAYLYAMKDGFYCFSGGLEVYTLLILCNLWRLEAKGISVFKSLVHS